MRYLKQKLFHINEEYTKLMENSAYVFFSGFGIFAVVVAYVVNYTAGRFATVQASFSQPVADIFLDRTIPLHNAFLIHVGVSSVLIFAVLALLWFLPRYMPFALLSLALLILTRTFFINLTYLGIYPDAFPVTGSSTTFGGDLFFSGHVAIPLLFAFILWRETILRYLFIGLAILLGASALLAHVHYTVDVFAAPFIAYGVFKIATRVFHRSYSFLPGREDEERGGVI